MPDPTLAIAIVLVAALVEATPLARVPIGLLLATAVLATELELGASIVLGAVGVAAGRATMASTTRSGTDALASARGADQQRETLQAALAGSRSIHRLSFALGAMPWVPGRVVFPMIGALRAPLLPALVGTVVGRTVVFAITTSLWVWLADLFTDSDEDGALLLGICALLLLAWRTARRIDWDHRAETGRFRLRPNDDRFIRFAASIGGSAPRGGQSETTDATHAIDIIEGEIVDEESIDIVPGELAPPDEDHERRES